MCVFQKSLLVMLIGILVSCSQAKDRCDWGTKDCFYNKVVHGKKQARVFNIPTANILVEPGNLKEGVYCCSVFLNKEFYKGICYYDNLRKYILEAHIYNYQGNLYGQNIGIILKTFTRPPVKGISLKDLKNLIRKDVAFCK